MRFQCCEKSFKGLPPPHGASKKYYNSLCLLRSVSHFVAIFSLLQATPQRRGILTIVFINFESVKLVERERSVHKIYIDVFFSRIREN